MRAVLLLAVAVGLVLMHHVVGAHEHAADQPADDPMRASSGYAWTAHGFAAGAPAAHRLPSAAPLVPEVGLTISSAHPDRENFAAPERPSAAALHVHHDQTGHHDMVAMLHMCLAVLAAALALARALLGRRFDLEQERLARAPRGVYQGRPPLPVPLLLAQLQVLRL